jgi:hypothetical protein
MCRAMAGHGLLAGAEMPTTARGAILRRGAGAPGPRDQAALTGPVTGSLTREAGRQGGVLGRTKAGLAVRGPGAGGKAVALT